MLIVLAARRGLCWARRCCRCCPGTSVTRISPRARQDGARNDLVDGAKYGIERIEARVDSTAMKLPHGVEPDADQARRDPLQTRLMKT